MKIPRDVVLIMATFWVGDRGNLMFKLKCKNIHEEIEIIKRNNCR